MKTPNSHMAHQKDSKRRHIELDSDSDNDISTTFPQFIVLESIEDQCLTKLSPFVIKKVIDSVVVPRDVKTLGNGSLLIEVAKKAYADNLLNMKTFFNIKIKAYAHRTLNSSRGVVRSSALSLCTLEELRINLSNQGVTDVRRISIKRNDESILTNTYIMTFNKPKTPTELKIGYQVVKVDVYIPNPLRCYKCQKFGHHESRCTRQAVCKRCGEKEPDHEEKTCEKDRHCVNCGEAHSADSKSCRVWKKEKEISHVKCTENISFPEARKKVESSVAFSQTSYASVLQKTSEPKQQCQSCLQLIEKLKQLTPETLPKFIESLSVSDSPKSTSNKTSKAKIKTNSSVETSSQESISQSEKSTAVRQEVSHRQRNTPKEKISLEKPISNNRFAPLEHMDSEELEGRNWTPPKDMCSEDSASGVVDWTAPTPQNKQNKIILKRS